VRATININSESAHASEIKLKSVLSSLFVPARRWVVWVVRRRRQIIRLARTTRKRRSARFAHPPARAGCWLVGKIFAFHPNEEWRCTSTLPACVITKFNTQARMRVCDFQRQKFYIWHWSFSLSRTALTAHADRESRWNIVGKAAVENGMH
jgi:hypothetical protein